MSDDGTAPARAGALGSSDPAWTPFQQAWATPLDESRARQLAELAGVPLAAVYAEQERVRREETHWCNSRYQVNVRRFIAAPGRRPMTHLSVKRLDKGMIHVRADLQRIKDELAGPECEALELYPAESRLVDTSNQYHLWVLPQGECVPFGPGHPQAASQDMGSASRHAFPNYEFVVRRFFAEVRMPVLHVMATRLDYPGMRDWRDLQRLKNRLAGSEAEAFELYPARSRLVADTEAFHLWVLPPGTRVPFGYFGRAVLDQAGGGAVQRPFDAAGPV